MAVDSISIADQVAHPPDDFPLDPASALAFARKELESRPLEWESTAVTGTAPKKLMEVEAEADVRTEVNDSPARLQRLRRGNERPTGPTSEPSGMERISSLEMVEIATSGSTRSTNEAGGEVEGPEVYGCLCGAGGAEGCIDVACSGKRSNSKTTNYIDHSALES